MGVERIGSEDSSEMLQILRIRVKHYILSLGATNPFFCHREAEWNEAVAISLFNAKMERLLRRSKRPPRNDSFAFIHITSATVRTQAASPHRRRSMDMSGLIKHFRSPLVQAFS